MPVFSPANCRTLLFHTTDEDLPAGIWMDDTSTMDTRRREVFAKECKLATVHQHWRGEAKWYADLGVQDREAEITELLRRIVAATEARLAKNKADGLAVLDSLNLTT